MAATERRSARRSARERYMHRWRSASPAEVADLEGQWQVMRLTGPVPMAGIYKVVSGGRGRTGAWWSPLPDLGFSLSRLEDSVLLRYERPLSFLADEFRRESDGAFLGRARAFGRQYAWFRMVPLQAPEKERRGTTSPARTQAEADSPQR